MQNSKLLLQRERIWKRNNNFLEQQQERQIMIIITGVLLKDLYCKSYSSYTLGFLIFYGTQQNGGTLESKKIRIQHLKLNALNKITFMVFRIRFLYQIAPYTKHLLVYMSSHSNSFTNLFIYINDEVTLFYNVQKKHYTL